MRFSFIKLVVVICVLISGCFMGSSVLFLEKDTLDKPNQVKNPSFEIAHPFKRRLPDYWLVFNKVSEDDISVVRDSSCAYEGKWSLRIRNVKHEVGIVSDAFHINKESGYFIKCSAKALSKLQQPIKVQFITYGKTGKQLSKFTSRLRPSTEWKKTTISACFLGNSAYFARINLIIPKIPDNTVWVDDIGCYRVYYTTRK